MRDLKCLLAFCAHCDVQQAVRVCDRVPFTRTRSDAAPKNIRDFRSLIKATTHPDSRSLILYRPTHTLRLSPALTSDTNIRTSKVPHNIELCVLLKPPRTSRRALSSLTNIQTTIRYTTTVRRKGNQPSLHAQQ